MTVLEVRLSPTPDLQLWLVESQSSRDCKQASW